jgi:hypothetical protein
MKINKQKLFKSLLLSIPLAIVVFYVINFIMGSIIGGISTTLGFPIPYYHDVYETPNIEYYIPIIKIVDILIFYIIITLITYLKINKQQNIK